MARVHFRDTMQVLTGVARPFGVNELIVSKTDLKGHINYANEVFLRLAGYPEKEVIGAPHCLIRHPHMPHGVFRLLWDTLREGKEVFAFIVNRSQNGDHYWVFAHVTPSYDADGKIIGYHSNRRVVDENARKNVVEPLYASMRDAEAKFSNPKEKAEAGVAFLQTMLQHKGMDYDEFIFSLCK
ncbi:PAS domain-containing protein [Hyphomicrobium sp.]|uniref:PAS domain-containing protein n=1 Tax=Hyphomicrobium sp. TaxID=82 RepID=UPI002FE3FFAE